MRYHENNDFQLPPLGQGDLTWWSGGSSNFDTIIGNGGVSMFSLNFYFLKLCF